MKTLPAALVSHYQSQRTQIATLWYIRRAIDGEEFGFCDHDRSLTYGGIVYRAATGFTGSSIDMSSALNVDNLEVTGFFNSAAGIAKSEVESGLWDGSYFEIFEVCWSDLSKGRNVKLTGWLGQIQKRGDTFLAELRSLASAFQKNIGRVISPVCDAKFGDARCGYPIISVTQSGVAVSAVNSSTQITAAALASTSPSFVDGYFSNGVIQFTSGENIGFSQDIKTYSAGLITLYLPFPNTVTVGDLFTITPGCNKLLKTALGVYDGDCSAKWDNVINFRGDPEVPMLNKLLQIK